MIHALQQLFSKLYLDLKYICQQTLVLKENNEEGVFWLNIILIIYISFIKTRWNDKDKKDILFTF